ncbi:MAG: hypothetical protein N3B21_12035 [Clostridia bacterium]|nr:hypothetical protein [Clostridia bacterium]
MKNRNLFKSLISIFLVCVFLVVPVFAFAAVPSSTYIQDQKYWNKLYFHKLSNGTITDSWSIFDGGPVERPANTNHNTVLGHVYLYIDNAYHYYEGTLTKTKANLESSRTIKTYTDGSYDQEYVYVGYYSGTAYLKY